MTLPKRRYRKHTPAAMEVALSWWLQHAPQLHHSIPPTQQPHIATKALEKAHSQTRGCLSHGGCSTCHNSTPHCQRSIPTLQINHLKTEKHTLSHGGYLHRSGCKYESHLHYTKPACLVHQSSLSQATSHRHKQARHSSECTRCTHAHSPHLCKSYLSQPLMSRVGQFHTSMPYVCVSFWQGKFNISGVDMWHTCVAYMRGIHVWCINMALANLVFVSCPLMHKTLAKQTISPEGAQRVALQTRTCIRISRLSHHRHLTTLWE